MKTASRFVYFTTKKTKPHFTDKTQRFTKTTTKFLEKKAKTSFLV
jgi:hypothetical protein